MTKNLFFFNRLFLLDHSQYYNLSFYIGYGHTVPDFFLLFFIGEYRVVSWSTRFNFFFG